MQRLPELKIPIKLRDQMIGEISLEGVSGMQASDSTASRNTTGAEAEKLREAWLPEEIALVEAVADQAAQALENARLLGETQRKAERERITATIAGKVWSFSDIDTILQTALQELGTSLDATDGYIQLKMAESKPVTEPLPKAKKLSPLETPQPDPLDAASSIDDSSLTAAEEGDTSGE